jgi:hypothetical protein
MQCKIAVALAGRDITVEEAAVFRHYNVYFIAKT